MIASNQPCFSSSMSLFLHFITSFLWVSVDVIDNQNISSMIALLCSYWIIIWLINSTYVQQGGTSQPQKAPQQDAQQGTSFTLQLFQRTLEETLDSFQKSIHEDMRNLHIEILRQFHMQEVCIFSVLLFTLCFLPEIHFCNHYTDGNVKCDDRNSGKPI